jgi:ribosomal protein S27AE
MYFLQMNYRNARLAGTGDLLINRSGDRIAKWTLLDEGTGGLELLRLISAACGGTEVIPRLNFDLSKLYLDSDHPLQVELALGLFAPYEAVHKEQGPAITGVRIHSQGELTALKKPEFELLHAEGRLKKAKTGIGASAFFLLGYGCRSTCHNGDDDFDFGNPYFRFKRIHSLFERNAPLTDPIEFLTRLHYRGIRWKRPATGGALERLASLFHQELNINSTAWIERDCDFKREWKKLSSLQRRIAVMALDAVRHLIGAHQMSRAPLDTPALILFDRPDIFCARGIFPNWARLMDALFPHAQFIITLDQQSRRAFPNLLSGTCMLPMPEDQGKLPSRLPRKAVLLVDMDSRLPNLALMKLSRFFKDQGRKVFLARHEARLAGVECVYASGIFSMPSTLNRLSKLQRYYGDALIVGGTGIDVSLRLPPEVESLAADYSLYPELGDRAIGFLTRGCPFRCPFCVVPAKEGDVRQVCGLDDLMTKGRRKLILLDDNILSHPKANVLLEEMARRNLAVNFNQTLDLRFVDRDIARLLLRIQGSNARFTRRVYQFSLKDNQDLDGVRRKYDMFGFTPRDNVEFVCMYGYDTNLAQDVERFRFLRSLPGAYVFVQFYRQPPGCKPANLAEFFDERAAALIDELIRIVFPQNMKSMENYYRWISKLYAQKFGRPHMPLVDNIFRYNRREQRGHYLAALSNGLDSERKGL